MIPSIIHYCWFGGKPMPTLAEKCINSWKKYCPEYQIIRWDETNFDISQTPLYVRQAYSAKKWPFVTDYVRLQVIFEYGGIYLDTDVEVLRNLDPLLENSAFFCFEDARHVNTGLGFGARKGAYILWELMQDYRNIPFVLDDDSLDLTPCPARNTEVFLRRGLRQDGTTQTLKDGIAILSPEYLCPIDVHTMKKEITNNTYTIHHFAGSWLPAEDVKRQKYKVRKNRIEQWFGSHMSQIYESFYYSLKANGGNGVRGYINGIIARRLGRKK